MLLNCAPDPLAEGRVSGQGVERLDPALVEPSLGVGLDLRHLAGGDGLVDNVDQLEEGDASRDEVGKVDERRSGAAIQWENIFAPRATCL